MLNFGSPGASLSAVLGSCSSAYRCLKMGKVWGREDIGFTGPPHPHNGFLGSYLSQYAAGNRQFLGKSAPAAREKIPLQSPTLLLLSKDHCQSLVGIVIVGTGTRGHTVVLSDKRCVCARG